MMKKLVYAVMLCLGATGFVACSVDTDSEASVTIQYEGYCDSVVFVHPEDTVFEKYIREVIATKTIPLVGAYSAFNESYTSQTTLYGDSVDFTPLGYYTVYYSLYGFLNERMVQIGTTYKEY